MAEAEPTTTYGHGFDAPTVGVSVHSTAALLDRNGRAAERSLVRYMARAFERGELNYEIDHGYPAKEPPREMSLCGEESAFPWWRDRVGEAFPERKDSNILLCDANGGGCGSVGGNVATAPAMNVVDEREHGWIGRDDFHRNLFGSLHELSHNLGFHHSPNPGMGWNEDGEWHRTITVSANDEANLCGERIERREHVAQARHMYFHDCAVERMSIDDAEPLGVRWGPDAEVESAGIVERFLGALRAAVAWVKRRLRGLLGDG